MEKNRLINFKQIQEDLINKTPGCENYVQAAKNIAGDLEYYDLVPVVLTRNVSEVHEYIQAMTGVAPHPEMSAVMLPLQYPDGQGDNLITAIVLVGYDCVDLFGFDDATKNHVITSFFVHELTHVKQLLSLGLEKFQSLSFNLTSNADKNEYLNNVLEKEAYKKQNEYLASKNVDLKFGVGTENEEFGFKCGIIFPSFID